MTQSSLPWQTNGVGDGPSAAYDDDTWATFHDDVFNSRDTSAGVVPGIGSELLVTNPSAYTLRVPAGAAWVGGRRYKNTANVDLITTLDGTSITAPLAGSNYYTVILRADLTAQTIRAAVLDVSVSAFPVGVHSAAYWDVEIAHFLVTSVPVKTLTDTRKFTHQNLVPLADYVQTGVLDDWATPESSGSAIPFKPTSPRIQAGVALLTIAGGFLTGGYTLTYPKAFSKQPIVVATLDGTQFIAGAYEAIPKLLATPAVGSETSQLLLSLKISASGSSAAPQTYEAFWIAYGEE